MKSFLISVGSIVATVTVWLAYVPVRTFLIVVCVNLLFQALARVLRPAIAAEAKEFKAVFAALIFVGVLGLDLILVPLGTLATVFAWLTFIALARWIVRHATFSQGRATP